MNLVVHIIRILVMWSVAGTAFFGLGALLRRLFGLRIDTAEESLRVPWLGWGLSIVLLQLWHLWLPVNGIALSILAALGVLGLLWSAPDLWRVLCSRLRVNLVFALLLATVAVWLAYHGAQQADNYDSGLYQLSSVRWANTYPIVPGLANLHGRFGFNNSYFLYVAMLDCGWFAHRSHQLGGGLLLFFALGRGLLGAYHVLSPRGSRRAYHLMDFLLLVPIIRLPMFGYQFASNPSADHGVYMLGFVVGSELLRLLERCSEPQMDANGRECVRSVGDMRFALVSIAFLSAVGITAKLSFVIFAVAACLLALVVVWRTRGMAAIGWKTVLWAAAAVVLTVVPWMSRGVILSGYPAYPSAVAGCPVEWRVDEAVTRHDAAIVRSWARKQNVPPEDVLGNWSWLWLWINGVVRLRKFEVVVPLALAFVLTPLLVLLRGIRGTSEKVRPPLVWLFPVVPLVVLAAWFFLVPEPRFAGMAFWLLGAGALALSLKRFDRELAAIVALTCMLIFFGQTLNILEFVHVHERDLGPARVGETEIKVTDSGLEINVPVNDNRAWDAPLPWTPDFNPKLQLRDPGNLGRGFILGE